MKFLRLAVAAIAAIASLSATAQQVARKSYIVQLADVPVAAYTGTISGLAATRPAPGTRLDVNATAVLAYVAFLDQQRNTTLAAVSSAPVIHRYRFAFNGFAAKLTPAEVAKLKADPRVLAINQDTQVQSDTTRTPGFLGLTAPGGLWSQLDSQARNIKGEDVIVGIIDGGVWPENPSFSDKVDANGKPVASHLPGTVVYGPPPAKWTGICVTGEGFPASKCNNKLIGTRVYNEALLASGAVLQPIEYQSPRDANGHGSHTASTAAGNSGVDATENGQPIGAISGIAPRARIAVYKTMWSTVASGASQNGQGGDLVAAIDQAVADGVDVLNYSISGSRTNFLDPVEVAFLFAAEAGVFVAASAGNSGPANTVAHMSPWITTVAASTHDRLSVATATLGNGAVYSGASLSTGVPSKPLILSTAAALIAPFDDTNTNARLCILGALDPVKVAGKIVVCDRGVNARVEKSQEVANRGGVGMVLTNTSPNTLNGDAHFVPTVHLADTDRTAVRTYAGAGGATAALGVAAQASGVIAPVMAAFSSRGPNLANASILKPDITAPGVDITAAYSLDVTVAERDAIVAGTLIPPAAIGTISGTSMSSPHIAGAAALMRQLRPTWSPAAIKSALMTSAGGVKLADGTPDPDRFGYGAGHLNPNAAAATGLVYDAGFAEYLAFLCGIGSLNPSGSLCQAFGSIQPWNLNLASLTGDAVGKITFKRTIKNASGAAATYVASASLPGYTVAVVPATVTLAAGQSRSVDVNVTRTTAATGNWTFGNLVWTSGAKQVRSPLTVRALLAAVPTEVSDGRAAGTKLITIGTGYNGTMTATPAGLVAAIRGSGVVATNQTQCFNVAVPAGTLLARFSLFNDDTAGGAGSDLDLEVYLGSTLVGGSGSGTSDERVDLPNPVAGNYTACVIGFAPLGGSAAFTLSSWALQPGAGVGNLKTVAPSTVYVGGTATAAISWSATAGKRYLGMMQLKDGSATTVGQTLITIDAASVVTPTSSNSAGRKKLTAIKK